MPERQKSALTPESEAGFETEAGIRMCMLIAALIPAVFTMLDVMSAQLARYQQVAPGMQWAEVPPKLQGLFVMSHLSGRSVE